MCTNGKEVRMALITIATRSKFQISVYIIIRGRGIMCTRKKGRTDLSTTSVVEGSDFVGGEGAAVQCTV